MKKPDLLKFIELYNLAGSVERVKIESDGTKLKTVFITEDKTLYGTLTFENIGLEAGEYGIYDTKQLIKMLNVLEDDITATVEKLDDGRTVAISFSDKNTESLVMLADLSIIPKAPKGVQPGTADFGITMDQSFVERYIRAKSALADVPTLTFLTNPKTDKAEMIIGHGNTSSNRIRLEVTPVVGKEKPAKPVSFNADYLREILVKNRDGGSTNLSVNSNGLAHVRFKTKVYEANYYLLKVTTL